MAIKPLNSVAGFAVGEVPTSIILANGDITTINFTANGISNLGPVGNVIITGGSADQVLKTDGAGNLSWSSGSTLANGYSNVSIPVANGNVVIHANGGTDQQWTFSNTGVLSVPGNIFISNSSASFGILTDNLYYSNGQPWDLQEAAGSATEIQYNDGLNNFGASANFTYNEGTRLLTVLGNAQFNNANLGNLAIANYINVSNQINGNIANFTGNLTSLNAGLGNLATANFVNVSSNLQVTNTANVGNLRTDNLLYANGQPWDLQEAAGSNTQVQYNDGLDNFGASANFTYDEVVSNLTVVGNIIATHFYGNISGNITAPGANTEVIFNDNTISNAVANFTYNKVYNSGGGQLNVGNTFGGEIITDNVFASYGNIGNLDVTTDIVAGGNISTTGSGGDITMSGGDITGVDNISANSANFTGNVSAANLVGALANGTSNVKVYLDSNVNISINGTPNIATIASTGLYVVGEIHTTAGNMLSNGNVTANGFLNGANANVTGEAKLGSVLTSNITAPTGSITISAAGSNQNIILSPTGVGNVDVGLHNIIQVGAPVNPNDAATKEYVDNVSQGLYIHPSANVTSVSNLNASYLNGGTVLSVTTISGGKTITFSTNHGLSVDSDIEFTNSFNGIIAGEGYYVYSVPASNQITIKDGYFGAEVTTLTNATGLTQPATGEGGVGATLTNSGAQAALTIDSILMTVGARVLVQGQTNQDENGIYEVTTVGNVSTNWVLTRASDGNSYAPKSDSQLGSGSYFFITQGTQYAGSSYVLTAPPGEIHFGISDITFSQFSKAGSYTAGNGIAINGTIISANVDLETTDIVGGNIVVKTSANLTTPNVGDATFSSLSWNNLSNGNVTANNLSIGSYANITLDLTVDGTIQANGNISSNANVNGNNAYFTNFADVGANLVANNISANYEFSTTNANISANLVTSNATVNLELSGNTANFSGNVIVPNVTVNLELAGNTANFSGNVVVPNLKVNLEISGNTANFSGNVFAPAIVQNASTYDTRIELNSAAGIIEINSNGNGTQFAPSGQITLSGASKIIGGTFGGSGITLGTSQTDLVQNRGGNVTIQVGTGGTTTDTWTFANNGNTIFPANGTFNVGNTVTANNANISNSITLGNTAVYWGTLTTTSITANQTIATCSATGVTGVEFLVKGVSSTKSSVATVIAVTNGSSVDFSTFGTVQLGGYTGSLSVNIDGSNISLQVTPASSNSTVWTTQYRLI